MEMQELIQMLQSKQSASPVGFQEGTFDFGRMDDDPYGPVSQVNGDELATYLQSPHYTPEPDRAGAQRFLERSQPSTGESMAKALSKNPERSQALQMLIDQVLPKGKGQVVADETFSTGYETAQDTAVRRNQAFEQLQQRMIEAQINNEEMQYQPKPQQLTGEAALLDLISKNPQLAPLAEKLFGKQQAGQMTDYQRQSLQFREQDQQMRQAALENAKLSGELNPKQLGAALSLSNSLKSHPAYTDMLDIATGLSGVRTGLSQQNGFGDITAMNAFQRMVDPGATVRSEDVVLMQSASALINKILSDYPIEKLTKGAKLPDATRKMMTKTAEELHARRAKNYNDMVGSQYRGLAKAAGIDFELVGRDFAEGEQGGAQGDGTKQPKIHQGYEYTFDGSQWKRGKKVQ